MTKKALFILFGIATLTGMVSCSTGKQTETKTLRRMLKDRKGADALKKVEELSKDSLMALQPKLYNWGVQAQILVNDVENEKIYLKQSYDTVRFFNSTYGIFDYALQCEKLEQQLLAEQGKKMKYHKDNVAVLQRYYPNLCAAGRYFYKKKQYGEVTKFMEMVLDVPHMPIWGSERDVTRSRRYTDHAYLHLRSAYLNEDYNRVERYKSLVLADSAYRYNTLEMLAMSAFGRNDIPMYLDYLKQGLRENPLAPFFFTHLTDYFTGDKEYGKALALADSMLTIAPDNILFLISKSVSLLNLQRNEEAISVAQRILQLDSTAVLPNYYVGAAYCNLANTLTLPTNINSAAYKQVASRQKYYYSEARPYIEKYRKAAPEAKSKWAPLLYRIYLSLNMGTQFSEIEKIMKTL